MIESERNSTISLKLKEILKLSHLFITNNTGDFAIEWNLYRYRIIGCIIKTKTTMRFVISAALLPRIKN